jgi:hypothetical protein
MQYVGRGKSDKAVRIYKWSSSSIRKVCLCVIGKRKDGVGVVSGHTVVGEQRVQDGTEHVPLRGPPVEGQRGGCVVVYPHHLGAVHQDIQDLFAEGGVQSQVPWLSDELGGHYGVEC